MKPIHKLLAVSALAVLFAVGFGGSAPAASYRVQAVGAVSVCACCPATCSGGTYWGCWSSPDHPSDAVTCIYTTSGGQHFNCVSCLNKATPETEKPISADLN